MDNFSIYLPGILMAYSAFLLGIASPGPNVLAVIGTSMGVGRGPAMALALGIATGSFCWATLAVLGLSALLSTYASALITIKIGGGLYLHWLAIKAFKSAASAQGIETEERSGGRRTSWGYWLQGVTVQMTNPKAALTWIAIMSLGLQNDAPGWVGLVIVAGTTILSIVIHLLYAIAFSTPVMMKFYLRSRRVIQAMLGTFFAFAGIRLLTGRM
ncbi:LysE family transporter [Agrobacterium rubi]|nr:LysE family transporter [Agrobacterium rubi]NTF20599.1 LysE family transporter [Agrobacterium rubi]NTF27569.1 LysE family transporter [Agrobacterium rubi]